MARRDSIDEVERSHGRVNGVNKSKLIQTIYHYGEWKGGFVLGSSESYLWLFVIGIIILFKVEERLGNRGIQTQSI